MESEELSWDNLSALAGEIVVNDLIKRNHKQKRAFSTSIVIWSGESLILHNWISSLRKWRWKQW